MRPILLIMWTAFQSFILRDNNDNKNALSSGQSRLFVDTIRSEEANTARAFVIRRGGGGGGGSAYKRAGDARRLA